MRKENVNKTLEIRRKLELQKFNMMNVLEKKIIKSMRVTTSFDYS